MNISFSRQYVMSTDIHEYFIQSPVCPVHGYTWIFYSVASATDIQEYFIQSLVCPVHRYAWVFHSFASMSCPRIYMNISFSRQYVLSTDIHEYFIQSPVCSVHGYTLYFIQSPVCPAHGYTWIFHSVASMFCPRIYMNNSFSHQCVLSTDIDEYFIQLQVCPFHGYTWIFHSVVSMSSPLIYIHLTFNCQLNIKFADSHLSNMFVASMSVHRSIEFNRFNFY